MKSPAPQRSSPNPAPACEVCILAGGLSSRMGRDKARLRLGRRTLLGQVRALAGGLGLPVRVIRRDLVPRCGPLGGIHTALKTTRAEAVLFLSCDMPFVSADLIERLLPRRTARPSAIFVEAAGIVGFPFLLPRAALPGVAAQMTAQRFSLQALATALRARRMKLGPVQSAELFNVNTPDDFAEARLRWQGNVRTRLDDPAATPCRRSASN